VLLLYYSDRSRDRIASEVLMQGFGVNSVSARTEDAIERVRMSDVEVVVVDKDAGDISVSPAAGTSPAYLPKA